MRQPPSDPIDSPSTCDCENDPIACLERMFVQQVQLGRIEAGQCPARRPVFLRLHGVAHARFEVVDGLPKGLQVGVFETGRSYPTWVRFSSDLSDGRPDLKSTVGIGIKLFDVPGEKVLGPDHHAPTHDFLLQNIDVFFVDDAKDMCAFTQAALAGQADAWLTDHPRTKQILDQMEKVVPTVLGTELWSVIPFHYGADRYCKYKLVPTRIPEGPAPDLDDPNYMAVDLAARLRGGEARFAFYVQLRDEAGTSPLDQATVAWPETPDRMIHVADLVIPQQDVEARGQREYGETLAFDPWRTLAVHEPVGSIAEARKVVYAASAALRRNVNGQPLGEPYTPRPTVPYPPCRDTHIVRAEIHPSIGIARVGNSKAQGEQGFYIGPEVPTPPPHTDTRDASGAIKRQAARFRVYGFNAAGEVVRELTADDADVHWTVHVANRKAAWFQFQAALDLPETATMVNTLRNPKVKTRDRGELVIDPGPRSIEGKSTSGPSHQLDGGRFRGVEVPLGELRTDTAGRLLVLGGFGNSASPSHAPVFDPAVDTSFNNADDWYDDISDGPVTARVTLAGREIPVAPAWVAVGPPNFAPDLIGLRTMYDLLWELFVTVGDIPYPSRVSFAEHILPTLERLTTHQWLNAGFAAMFGAGQPFDFSSPQLRERLAQAPTEVDGGVVDPWAELRQVVYNSFRAPGEAVTDPRPWPWLYGDTFGLGAGLAPNANFTLTPVRARLFQQWVEGDFEGGLPTQAPPQAIDQVPLAERPATLTEAALTFCLADAFHPGAELTWPLRHASMYSEPFRIRHRPAGEPEPDYGPRLTQAVVLRPNGPLYAQGPGDLTRWMALPWQGDTAYCRSGYDLEYDPYLPTFWPARVPNQVLTQVDFEIATDTRRPLAERLAAFNNRESWLRFLSGPPPAQMQQMIDGFGKQGILEARTWVPDDPQLPALMLVESLPAERTERRLEADVPGVAAAAAPVPAHLRKKTRLERAGWESHEQHQAFRALRFNQARDDE
jgi:hypothetical protein